VHDLPALDHWPSDDTDRAVVLLHGRKRSPGAMRDLAAAMGLLTWRCSFPAADEASWYPKGFMKPIEANEPDMEASVDRISREIDRLGDEGFPPERIVVGGFSQGACVVCEYFARRPTRHLGAVILSGALAGPDGRAGRAPRPELKGLPTFISGSRADPWVSLARVDETAQWFREGGAIVDLMVLDDRLHVVDDREIDRAAAMLADL
jgi:phospholipase/carboxylesterase